jgi:hypothetical protein
MYRYWIQLDLLGVSKPGGGSTYANSALQVVLDAGATVRYLPRAIVEDLARDMGGQVVDGGGMLAVP